MPSDAMTGELDVSVCVLARHRVNQLVPIYRNLRTYFNRRNLSSECIVVSNGLDQAEEVFLSDFSRAFPNENGRLRLVNLRTKSEKAASLKAIEDLVRGRVILCIESAGEIVTEEDVENLLNGIDRGFDLVNGARDWSAEPILNRCQSTLFNFATRIATGSKGRDLNSTMKAFRRDVLKGIPLYGDFYRFLPILAERHGFNVTEVPVKRRQGQKTSTIYGPMHYVRRLLEILNLIFITRFTEKPLRFFGGWGICTAAIGIVINFVLVIQRLFYGQGMADRPMLLLGILLIVAGIQFISIGLIGEMIVYSRTKEFKGLEIEEVL